MSLADKYADTFLETADVSKSYLGERRNY